MDYAKMDFLDKVAAIRYSLCPMVKPIALAQGLSIQESNKAPFELEFHLFRTATLAYQVAHSTRGLTKEQKDEVFEMLLWHDIAKVNSRVVRKWALSRKLSRKEKREMEDHVKPDFIDSALEHGLCIDPKKFPARLKAAAALHHWRINGSGYPIKLPREIFGIEIDEYFRHILELIGVIDLIEAKSSDLRFYARIDSCGSKGEPLRWWILESDERSNLLDAINTAKMCAAEGSFDPKLVDFVSHCFVPKQPRDPFFLPEVIGNYLGSYLL
jgi:hypothetical protein